MVAHSSLTDIELDRLFQALSDTTRRDILRRTLTEAPSVTVLSKQYDMSFAAVQKHVAVLESAGLVRKTAVGRQRLIQAEPDQIGRARAVLAQFEALWRHRLTALDDILAEPKE